MAYVSAREMLSRFPVKMANGGSTYDAATQNTAATQGAVDAGLDTWAAGLNSDAYLAHQAAGTLDQYYATLKAQEAAYLADPSKWDAVTTYNAMLEAGISVKDALNAGVAQTTINQIFTSPALDTSALTSDVDSVYTTNPYYAAAGAPAISESAAAYYAEIMEDGVITGDERLNMLQIGSSEGVTFQDIQDAAVDANIMFDTTCPAGQVFDQASQRCVADGTDTSCPTGKHYDAVFGGCVNDIVDTGCQPGMVWDDTTKQCVAIFPGVDTNTGTGKDSATGVAVYQPLDDNTDIYAAGVDSLDTAFRESDPRTEVTEDVMGTDQLVGFDYTPAAKLLSATGSGFSWTPPSVTSRPRSLMGSTQLGRYTQGRGAQDLRQLTGGNQVNFDRYKGQLGNTGSYGGGLSRSQLFARMRQQDGQERQAAAAAQADADAAKALEDAAAAKAAGCTVNQTWDAATQMCVNKANTSWTSSYSGYGGNNSGGGYTDELGGYEDPEEDPYWNSVSARNLGQAGGALVFARGGPVKKAEGFAEGGSASADLTNEELQAQLIALDAQAAPVEEPLDQEQTESRNILDRLTATPFTKEGERSIFGSVLAGIPGAVESVYDYGKDVVTAPSPSAKLLADIFVRGGAMKQSAEEDPIGYLANILPPSAQIIALNQVEELNKQVNEARRNGNEEEARRLEKFITVTALGAFPFIKGGSKPRPPGNRVATVTPDDIYRPVEGELLPAGAGRTSSRQLLDEVDVATTGSVKMLDEADVNQPIDKISFIQNTEPNPALQNIKKQELYGTHIEPAGQYVSPVSESYLAELSTNNPANFLTGVKTFKNPLVIKFGGSYGASDNWKQVLHRQYGNKSGMDLNSAIRADGYDGIVTVDAKGNLSEIVDLTVGKGNVDLKAAPSDAARMLNDLDPSVKYEGMRDATVQRLKDKGIMSDEEFRIAELNGYAEDPKFTYSIDDSGSNSSYITLKKTTDYDNEYGVLDFDEYTLRFSDHSLPSQYSFDRNMYNVSNDYYDETINGKSLEDAIDYVDRLVPATQSARMLDEVDAVNVPKLRQVDAVYDSLSVINNPRGLDDIGRAFNDRIAENPQAMIDQYNLLDEAEGGKILNTDLGRELDPNYRADRSLSNSVHVPASMLTDTMFNQRIAQTMGDDGIWVFSGGGPGSGKTVGLTDEVKANADVVVDGTLAKFEKNAGMIDRAVASGKEVRIVYVDRNPAEALKLALFRAKKMETEQGSGRVVPLVPFIDMHRDVRESIKKLTERYKSNDRVNIDIWDNQGSEGAQFLTDIDNVSEMSYNDALMESFEVLEEAHKKGDISEAIYRGTKADYQPPAQTSQSSYASSTREAGQGNSRRNEAEGEKAAALRLTDKQRQAWRENNKGNFRREQTPELSEAAEKLGSGEISIADYTKEVQRLRPIEPFTTVPKTSTFEEIASALNKDQVEKGIIGLDKEIADGTPVGSRLDIPAYDAYDTWVVSVHSGTGSSGSSLGYGKVAVLDNVVFNSSPDAAYKIATGQKNKSTFARMNGKWRNVDPEVARKQAEEYLTNPDWVQVGMNPYRHSFFYDKATGQPLASADEVIQIGPLVLARNAKTRPLESREHALNPKKRKEGEPEFFKKGGSIERVYNDRRYI